MFNNPLTGALNPTAALTSVVQPLSEIRDLLSDTKTVLVEIRDALRENRR